MRVKYNRVSTIGQTGDRFSIDTEKYDLVLFDKISGKIPFMQREKGMALVKLVEAGKVTEVVVEELSRLGRHVGDVIKTLEYLEEQKINVIVRNIGLQSRPNNDKNPIWGLITAVMTSLYAMELENIKERTASGRAVYVQKGGKLGRPEGACEGEKKFIDKPKSREIIKYLNKKRTVREIGKITKSSNKTVIKTKKIAFKYGLIHAEVA